MKLLVLLVLTLKLAGSLCKPCSTIMAPRKQFKAAAAAAAPKAAAAAPATQEPATLIEETQVQEAAPTLMMSPDGQLPDLFDDEEAFPPNPPHLQI